MSAHAERLEDLRACLKALTVVATDLLRDWRDVAAEEFQRRHLVVLVEETERFARELQELVNVVDRAERRLERS